MYREVEETLEGCCFFDSMAHVAETCIEGH